MVLTVYLARMTSEPHYLQLTTLRWCLRNNLKLKIKNIYLMSPVFHTSRWMLHIWISPMESFVSVSVGRMSIKCDAVGAWGEREMKNPCAQEKSCLKTMIKDYYIKGRAIKGTQIRKTHSETSAPLFTTVVSDAVQLYLLTLCNNILANHTWFGSTFKAWLPGRCIK